MLDNQRVLDETMRRQRMATDQTMNLRAAQTQQAGAALAGSAAAPDSPPAPAEPAEDEMGNILIDSPNIHNHYYGAQPAPSVTAAPPVPPGSPAPAPVQPTAVQTAAPATSTPADGFVRVTEQLQPNGTWVEIRRELYHRASNSWTVMPPPS